jgi:hypothetical protein
MLPCLGFILDQQIFDCVPDTTIQCPYTKSRSRSPCISMLGTTLKQDLSVLRTVTMPQVSLLESVRSSPCSPESGCTAAANCCESGFGDRLLYFRLVWEPLLQRRAINSHYMRLLTNNPKFSEPCETNPIQEVCLFLTTYFIATKYHSFPDCTSPNRSSPSLQHCLRDGPICGLHFAFQSLARSSNQVLLIHV